MSEASRTMIPSAPKVTAEAFLSAPRSTPPVPNGDGSLGLYTVSTHTFGCDGAEGADETVKEWRLMNLTTGDSQQLWVDDKVHNVSWIPGGEKEGLLDEKDDEILYLRSEEGGRTKVLVGSVRDVAGLHYEVAEFRAPIGNVKLRRLSDGLVAFVFTGLVGEDGHLFNEEGMDRKQSTGRVFDTYNIRVVNPYHPPLCLALMNDGESYMMTVERAIQRTSLWPMVYGTLPARPEMDPLTHSPQHPPEHNPRARRSV